MLFETVAIPQGRSPRGAAAAYENTFDNTGTANIEDFLPLPSDPEYPAVLAQLLRVDMRLHSAVGQRRHLDDYRHLYPVGLADPERSGTAAKEACQTRVDAGDPVRPTLHDSRTGVDVNAWPMAEPKGLISLPLAETQTITPAKHREDMAAQTERASKPQPIFTAEMPRSGQRFLHFDLVRELGRGKFGRVFLAHQTQLADRPVALKVTAETDSEPQLLASLQHTNIVPIYAVYHAGPLQAICMPYFGSVTLAQVINNLARDPKQLPRTGRGMLSTLFETRLNGSAPTRVEHEPAPLPTEEPPALAALGKLSQVNAALWIAARLADGLAHAHERGILHCDLKPANVLIADDGQPMLLDFNVAADRKSVANWRRAKLGGTIPYMAPEYLSLIHNDNGELSPRCDLFSLGVVLYELLTGSDPYPTPEDDVVSPVGSYLAAHSKLPELPSKRNPEITPAVDAIVCKLLDPDPRRRYAEASHAREDLERQLGFRPLLHAKDPSPRERLRKWRRRNPRLTTGLAVALAAVLFLILPATALAVRSNQIAARRHEVARSDAILAHQKAIRELKTAQVLLSSRSLDPTLIADGFERAQAAFDEYSVETDTDWANKSRVQLLSAEQQLALRQELGGTMLMLARVELARKPAGDQAAAEAAWKWNRLAADCYPADERPKLLARQRAVLATVLPKEVTPIADSPNIAPIDAFHDGYELAMSGQPAEALLKLIPFTDLHPDHFLAWYVRGVCHEAVGQYPDSAGAFTVCTTLWPDFAWSYFNRGVARLRQGKAIIAEADFTRALDRKPNWTDALINRAIARESLKNYDGADADLTAALDRKDAPTRAYFLRSRVRLANGDKHGAETDATEGRKQEPRDTISWITRGFWKQTADPHGALADYDAALALNPRSADALKNKAIVLADSLDQPAEAIKIMDELLELYPTHTEARAGRAVYLARVGDSKRAIADATAVLQEEPTPYRLYQMAGMYAQLSRKDSTGKARQQALQLAAKAFRTGFDKLNLIAGDPDMDPIREDTDFKELVQHARKLQTTVK
jgi:eukaryotic-like serine/threonine-protein kinase